MSGKSRARKALKALEEARARVQYQADYMNKRHMDICAYCRRFFP